MMQVSVTNAELLETGQETRIVLERDGKTVAKMEGCKDEPNGRYIKFGIAKGEWKYPDDINAYDDEIAELFDV